MTTRFPKWLTFSALLSLCPLVAACGGDDKGAKQNIEDQFPEAQHLTVKSTKARAPASQGVAALADFTEDQRAFNADLFAELPAELDGKNAMISALSVQQALGMTWAGAAGRTAAQMKDALHFDDDAHAMQNALEQALLSRAMPAVTSQNERAEAVELSMANAVWSRTDTTDKWRSAFLDALAVNYGAGVETLDFANAPEASRLFINAWVEAQTKERIKDLLPPNSIGSTTALVLTNAVYFKAPWQRAFEASLTEQGDFAKLDGAKVEADFVREQGYLAYAEGAGWQAVEKPFRGGDLRMLFVLPAAGAFDAFAEGFDDDRLDEIVAALQPAEVELALPKFEFETALSLVDPLKALGMTDAFDKDLADFSGMIDDHPLLISDVFHKTFVALDEKGVEAAAATAVVMTDTAAPPADEPKAFRADRPFFFAIRDAPTGAVLFYGRVMDPTAN